MQTTAFSSFTGTVFILSETEYQNYYAEHTVKNILLVTFLQFFSSFSQIFLLLQRDWIIFFVMAVIPIGGPLTVYLQKKASGEDKQKSN
jgi:hypothetical protein